MGRYGGRIPGCRRDTAHEPRADVRLRHTGEIP
ncbi:hypothetical protein L21_1446 [Methanoculleus chikugoensis]|uniref:Uncharacterized protein n=1 Tax=Methanoculleus chikugoensis TaxID=118126 RepID=A0A1M4ML33_9EURY|nr:hypothetical protein L21_1446 [Methanoculleus chikugoensis]